MARLRRLDLDTGPLLFARHAWAQGRGWRQRIFLIRWATGEANFGLPATLAVAGSYSFWIDYSFFSFFFSDPSSPFYDPEAEAVLLPWAPLPVEVGIPTKLPHEDMEQKAPSKARVASMLWKADLLPAE